MRATSNAPVWPGLVTAPERAGMLRLVVAVVVAGGALRLLGYLQMHSLWFDEAMLVRNLIEVPLSQLHGALPYYNQAAPVGFLVISKVIGSLTGYAEWGLRLFPVLTGIAVVPLTYLALRGALERPIALIATTLVAFSPLAIRYSIEFKHYGAELFASVVVLCLWRVLRERPTTPWLLAGSLILGLVLLTLSFTVILVMFAVGLTLAWEWRHELWRRRAVFAVLLVWGGAFVLLYVLQIRTVTFDQFEVHDSFWQGRQPLEQPEPGSFLYWHLSTLGRTLSYLLVENSAVPSLAMKALNGVLVIVFGLGLAVLWRCSRPLLVLVAATGLTCYALSLADVFPLIPGRYLLFVLPLLAAVLAAGTQVARVFAPGPGRARHLATLAALLLIAPAAAFGTWRAAAPQIEESGPLVERLLATDRDGDPILVYYGALPAFDYYTRHQPTAHLGGMDVPSGTDPLTAIRRNYEPYLRQLLASLGDAAGAWVIVSHVGGEEDEELLAALGATGHVRLVQEERGAALYRFTRTTP